MSDKVRTKKIEPFNLVVFGGDGDLALRKIYPALFHRYVDKQLSMDFTVFCVTRSPEKIDEIHKSIRTFIKDSVDYKIDSKKFAEFEKRLIIQEVSKPTLEGYKGLKTELEKTKSRQNVFYLSTPSSAFGQICELLQASNLVNEKSKVVLEKPLGTSLRTSKEIHEQISLAFTERQIYRIDHYLGKETVQNLMVLRFANHLFEHSWSSEDIDSVQITVAESLGVEKRGDYYDKSGALLDMVQNHLLQLLCLIAMEPPTKLEANFVRNEKLKVLNSLQLFDEKTVLTNTVKGQYTRGKVKDELVNSYLEDISNYESKTETFVAIKAYIDNWRWKGTPFYLRTGKRLTKRYSEIIINFKSVRHNVFPSQGEIPGNKLVIRLQPEERIELVQMTKIPGPGGYRYQPISLKLDYMDSFKERFPEAYERLLIDVFRGEQTLFMHQTELEAAWIWIESIVHAWEKTKMENVLYQAGSWGPGDKIMDEGHKWSKSFQNENEKI
jgi:glucose-6-phosphate 1-dehydrogenase|tara:strand:+ start:12366 stop:13853 length:1488 start_codon:yes stop_codon:yes gene_type:complete